MIIKQWLNIYADGTWGWPTKMLADKGMNGGKRKDDRLACLRIQIDMNKPRGKRVKEI